STGAGEVQEQRPLDALEGVDQEYEDDGYEEDATGNSYGEGERAVDDLLLSAGRLKQSEGIDPASGNGRSPSRRFSGSPEAPPGKVHRVKLRKAEPFITGREVTLSYEQAKLYGLTSSLPGTEGSSNLIATVLRERKHEAKPCFTKSRMEALSKPRQAEVAPSPAPAPPKKSRKAQAGSGKQ
ncbi:unnamed protein product, partial [Chrysoparadoxa australica]